MSKIIHSGVAVNLLNRFELLVPPTPQSSPNVSHFETHYSTVQVEKEKKEKTPVNMNLTYSLNQVYCNGIYLGCLPECPGCNRCNKRYSRLMSDEK